MSNSSSKADAGTAHDLDQTKDATGSQADTRVSSATTGLDVPQRRNQDIRFLLVAGSLFLVIMTIQYVRLILDKPEPIPWQKGEAAEAFLVNVNTASWAEWTQLEEVGPELAVRIVTDRDANGAFRDIDDLLRVEGIGRTTLDRIRQSLTIDSGP